ncbi:MAG: helix-turn-helix transcriptional regulator [Steroidobacteraceae bacterium]
MPTIENTDQPGTLPTPAFYRLRDVLRITGLSRPTLYRRIAACRFPRPVHLGGRACGWAHAALQDWIKDPDGYCAHGTQAAFWPASTPCRRKRSR